MKLDANKLPVHVGFIIDGNGRWAKRRGLPRKMGHIVGMHTLEKIAQETFELGVKVVSIYAFSTENWNRPQEELDGLFKLFADFFEKDSMKLKENGIRLQIMGDYTKFPQNLVDNCNKLLEETKDCDKFVLNLGINYGGKDEIVRAVNLATKDGKTEITKEDIDANLYTSNLPPLDFCIRSSGEQRISGFMIWQIAYSEMYFPKVLWPDFNSKHLKKALLSYQKRNRRFGAVKEDKKEEN